MTFSQERCMHACRGLCLTPSMRPPAEYKGHAREASVKDILKADMGGMFARCGAVP